MIDIKASAPGKVIIAGEYAVLDGAPAICMAVNRRAQVSIISNSKEHHTVAAPGFSESLACFESMTEAAEEFPLLAAVWRELQIETSDFLSIVLDSSGFRDAGAGKIGIGSSAALTVALTAALDCLAEDSRDIRSTAIAAHCRLQGGAGSGADIACSVAGGVTAYRMGENESDKLAWPDGLSYALLWSGVSVDTGTQLEKLRGADVHASRAELGASAQVVAHAWKSGDSGQVLNCLRDYTSILRRFDVDHELGIFDAGHANLAGDAGSTQLVYKPCGAGGGDLGVAISNDPSELAAFVDVARQRNFEPMDIAIDVTGVVVDGNKQ